MKRFSLFRIVAHFAVAVVTVSTVCASEKSIVMGGKNGWNNLLSVNGVTTGKGRFGFDSIELETKIPANDENTTLYLTFENGKIEDASGNYEVLENNLLNVTYSVKGKGSALSRGEKKGLVLRRITDSAMNNKMLAGSFTIEFWLCPSLAENGESIYSWRTSINNSKSSDYQMITAGFSNSRLEWKFKNVFPSFKSSEIVLSGYSPVIPGEWSRHTISFNEETGCLEYLVNGKTEAIKFITSTEHEGGSICMPIIGTQSVLELCPLYTGKIDSFRIQHSAYEKNTENEFENGNEKFPAQGGRFITQPVLVSHACVLERLEAVTNIPSETELKFFVRAGDNFYDWTETYPQWKEVVPGEQIQDVTGLYFQVAAELLPDGSCSKTPSVTSLTLKYTETEKPLPPFVVKAQAGNGQVELSWGYSVDDSAGGYYVYYGTKPGEYLGKRAVEGHSPVNAGNATSVTLTGLKNGEIYYFAVAAYSRIDKRIIGELSKEVFARPSQRNGF